MADRSPAAHERNAVAFATALFAGGALAGLAFVKPAGALALNMPDVAISSATSAIVIAFGVLMSLAIYLKTNLSPGGLVTAGVLAFSALEGVDGLLVILCATAFTWGAVTLASNMMILYGKRLFCVCLATSTLLMTTLFLLLHKGHPELFPGDTLGFVLPGLVAYQLYRQRPLQTLIVTAAATVATLAVTIVSLVV